MNLSINVIFSCLSISALSTLVDAEQIMTPYVSSQNFGKIEIKLEHPRILVGSGAGSVPNTDDLTIQYVAFQGLGVLKCGNNIYVNNLKFAVMENTKTIWISGDAKTVLADNKRIAPNKIEADDIRLIFSSEDSNSRKLDNGYTIKVQGLNINGGSGIVFDSNHCIFSMGLMVFKVWGDDVFLWDAKIGDLKKVGSDKTLIIDSLKEVQKIGLQ